MILSVILIMGKTVISGKERNTTGKRMNQIRLKIYNKMMYELKRNTLSKKYVDDDARIDNIRDAIAYKVDKSFDYKESVEDI
jgi:hypothetical protein